MCESALGITRANAALLRGALLEAAAASDAAVYRGHNGFGDVYALRFPMESARGGATVLSAWIVRDGEGFPRLSSCYVV